MEVLHFLKSFHVKIAIIQDIASAENDINVNHIKELRNDKKNSFSVFFLRRILRDEFLKFFNTGTYNFSHFFTVFVEEKGWHGGNSNCG